MARARGAGSEAATGAVYWLIAGGTEPPGVFVADHAQLGRALPVFSFREEAELFLALGGLGGSWRAVESGAGDFLALLVGPYANVKSVVLDPLPAMLRDGTAGLVSLSLDAFMDRFLGFSGRQKALDDAASSTKPAAAATASGGAVASDVKPEVRTNVVSVQRTAC